MTAIGGLSPAYSQMRQSPAFGSDNATAYSDAQYTQSSSPRASQRVVCTLSSLLGCAGILAIIAGMGGLASASSNGAFARALSKPYAWIKEGISWLGNKISTLYTKVRGESQATQIKNMLTEMREEIRNAPRKP